MLHVIFERGPGRHGVPRRTPTAPSGWSDSRRGTSAPEATAARTGVAADTRARARARLRRRRSRRRLRAHRLLPRALRHARRVPDRRAQRRHRQPRPPRRRGVRPTRRSRSTTWASRLGLATYGKVRSRFGGFPDVIGNLPASLLPTEITTPGELQVRALFVSAGNPVLSVPDGDALERGDGRARAVRRRSTST